MIEIHLPFPPEHCWPNKRSRNYHVNSTAEAKAKLWGAIAARQAKPQLWAWLSDDKIPLHLVVHPMPRGPAPDEDNIVAALKHSFDGIAAVLGVDDRQFKVPTLEFAKRVPGGAVKVRVG